MKKILLLLIAVLSLATFCNQAKAQKDTSIYKAWDDLVARIKKDKKPDPATGTRLKPITEQWAAGINKSVSAKPVKEPWKEWALNAGKHGDIDLLPLMEEAPPPIYTLSIAGQMDIDTKFNPYLSKIESQQKQLGEKVAKNSKLHQVYQKEGQEGLERRAMAESDKSKIIQQMGGMENLMKMSDAERKAAAQKMANDLRSNPGLISGNNNPGANAMSKKMMSDTAYANRFKKMSDTEKEAEVKKFMGENPHDQDANFDPAKHDKLMKEKNETKYVQDITLLNTRIQDRLKAATELYSKNIIAINNWADSIRNKIEKWYSRRYAAIPIVELGEYGHDKDPEQVQALEITLANLKYYILQSPEMQVKSDNWNVYKTNCKYAIGELNDFIASYKWGSNASENIFAPDADQQVAAGIGTAYGIMNQLATEAKNFTTTARGYQKQYETITSGR